MPLRFDRNRFKRNVQKVAADASDDDVRNRAERIRDRAKELVPVSVGTGHEGRLRDSIHVEKAVGNPRVTTYRVIADAKADGEDTSYAMAIEVGHVKRGAIKKAEEEGRRVPEDLTADDYVEAQPYMLFALQAGKDEG